MTPRLRVVPETLILADATGTSETLTFASCCQKPNHITWVLVGFSRSQLGLQPCLDVDETRSETSDGSLSITFESPHRQRLVVKG